MGSENVLGSADSGAYADPYSFSGEATVRPATVMLPGCVEDVRAVLGLATEHGIPLWPVSTGRNYGYGGASPRIEGSVVLDLHRMDRILHVDDESATALVEPGVTLMALYEHLRERGARLWTSVPDIGWGCVLGNALERGFGYTPYGDHASMQCGMEVVLRMAAWRGGAEPAHTDFRSCVRRPAAPRSDTLDPHGILAPGKRHLAGTFDGREVRPNLRSTAGRSTRCESPEQYGVGARERDATS